MGGQQFWGDRLIRQRWRIQQNILTKNHRLLDPRNIRKAWGSYEHCLDYLDRQSFSNQGGHMVMMIGGLGGFRHIFRRMDRTLRTLGHNTVVVSYPSTRHSIQDHARDIETVLNRLDGVDSITFVCHSMGGLIMRVVLDRAADWSTRVQVDGMIMIGTPNNGAHMAGILRNNPIYKVITTAAGQDLTPEVVRTLPPVKVRHRLIIGTTRPGRGINPYLDGDDDGIVAVSEALLSGSDDIHMVRGVHQYLPRHPKTIAAVTEFLEQSLNS